MYPDQKRILLFNLGSAGGGGNSLSAMKFHLAVYRLVKDPALKQASGLLDWFKVGPWRSTAQFPEPPAEPAVNLQS